MAHFYSAVDNIVVQIERFRDGTRKITSISETIGLKDGRTVLRDLMRFEFDAGDDEDDAISGRHCTVFDGKPSIYEQARKHGEHRRLMQALADGSANLGETA
ncbi:hypothetical protein [Marivita sp.]|uniref:hypothetical protein n=1 Tax=Marivita sp. TaxID=2003365 RepID=UPI003F6B94E8